jgi:Double zinc ribbon
MNCAKCGSESPDRAKFCLECGAAFASRCAACGTELPPAAKFCLECGAKLELAACRDRDVAAERRAPVSKDRYDFQCRSRGGRLRLRWRNVEEGRCGSSSDARFTDQDAEQRRGDENSPVGLESPLQSRFDNSHRQSVASE